MISGDAVGCRVGCSDDQLSVAGAFRRAVFLSARAFGRCMEAVVPSRLVWLMAG